MVGFSLTTSTLANVWDAIPGLRKNQFNNCRKKSWLAYSIKLFSCKLGKFMTLGLFSNLHYPGY